MVPADALKRAAELKRYALMEEKMLTEDSARNLAAHWIQAWNSHDLDEIMLHYGEDVVLVSPVVAKILNE